MDDTPQTAGPSGTTPPDVTLASAEVAVPGIERRHLLVFSGSSSWLYQLPMAGTVVIGRSEAADLRIDDASVSRQHASLTLDGDRISISDLGSQNRTFVNDVQISGEQELHANDIITIHKTTLILHTAATTPVAAVILEMPAFRQRLEDELDRAVRYERTFSVLCLVWTKPVLERRQLQRMVAEQLRRIDAAAWSETTLYVLLAEASADESLSIAARVRTRLDATSLRMGHASCPDDGYDVDALLASAHNAAIGAEPGVVGGTSHAFQTLTIGNERVIIADPAVARLYALIERLAPVDLPVLITGETGCGKELVATAIHAFSRRRAKQLISLNCAAIQETLVESELFGHEKGAFSGAVSTKTGLLEAASGSTLFLDEVGELAPSTQAKLLRVLESHRMTRVGDVREREIDVRIVAATNRDLEGDVASGKFRQDLFFRLSAATLHLPPLRQRPRDLPLLASAFLDNACRRASRSMMTISDNAMTALLAHAWPGNVRELKNLMLYVAAAHPADVLTAEHVAERLSRAKPNAPPVERAVTPSGDATKFRPIADELRELEVTRMKEALEATNGNQTRAASLLTMPVRTFFEKAKLYGITPKKKRDDATP